MELSLSADDLLVWSQVVQTSIPMKQKRAHPTVLILGRAVPADYNSYRLYRGNGKENIKRNPIRKINSQEIRDLFPQNQKEKKYLESKPDLLETVLERRKRVRLWGGKVDDVNTGKRQCSHVGMANIDYRHISLRSVRGNLPPIECQLDLHGLTQPHAYIALCQFINRAWQTGLRSVLIITGKGKSNPNHMLGILHTTVPLWLTEASVLRSKILFFTYARPADGGNGAIYLVIRQRRRALVLPASH